jgi:hypothetical protein
MSYGLTGLKLRAGDTLEHFREVMNGDNDEEEEYEGQSFTPDEQEVIREVLTNNGFRKVSDRGSEYELN